MPAQTVKSSLAAKLGERLNKAVASVASKPVEIGGFRQLPPGLSGLAQLVEMGFGVYDEGAKQLKADGTKATGQFYFYRIGVIRTPETAIDPRNNAEVRVLGEQTRPFPIPVCDSKSSNGTVTSLEENIDAILNEMKKFGVTFPDNAGGADMEAAAAALQNAKPMFKYSTRLGKKTAAYPEPMVMEFWNGTEGVDAIMASQNGQAPHADPALAGVEDATSSTTPSGELPDDLDELGALADAADGDVQATIVDKIRSIANSAGITDSELDADPGPYVATNNFVEMVGIIKAKSQAPTLAAATAAGSAPEAGQVCGYAARDVAGNVVKNKSTKKAQKEEQHEILSVDAGKKIVTLKNMITGKILVGTDKKPLGVPWGHLNLD